MEYDKNLVMEKLSVWKTSLDSYSLPSWDELPMFELYMDQVIILLTQYLSFIPQDNSNERCITASIINNYVRMRLVPHPVKKRYSRIHLAYLIMICTLKQSLSISYIRKLIPLSQSEDEVRETYSRFVRVYSTALGFFCKNAEITADKTFASDDVSSIGAFIMSAVIISNFSKFLAERLLDTKNTDV